MTELVVVIYKSRAEGSSSKRELLGGYIFDKRDLGENIAEYSDISSFENLVECCRKVKGLDNRLPDEIQTISGIINLLKSKGSLRDETRIPLGISQLSYFADLYQETIKKYPILKNK